MLIIFSPFHMSAHTLCLDCERNEGPFDQSVNRCLTCLGSCRQDTVCLDSVCVLGKGLGSESAGYVRKHEIKCLITLLLWMYTFQIISASIN